MKTILEAKETISHLWGAPKPKDIKYRLMKYLLQCKVEGGILLHNCVTGQLIFLADQEVYWLQKLPLKPTEEMQPLIANHFLVPEDFNEYRSVKQLRSIYQRRSTGDAINHFVILPTTFCNARCFYCYESDYPHVHMTEETGRKLIDYIDEHRKGKDVVLSWFGGEPLVGIDRIDQITQGLKDRGIQFASSMISNGYLFDEEVVAKSKRLWNLDNVQITLDGTETVYNKTKAYVSAKENPFKRVLRNIDLLSNNGVYVKIRLNVDFYNKENIRVLIEELGERYSDNKYIAVYLNMLFNNQGFIPVRHSDDDRLELQDVIEELTSRLKELKLSREKRRIPILETSQCMADNVHTIEVQPNGGFCRCEHENINECYGSIDEGITDPQKLQKWKENIERSELCPECCLFPSCYLLRFCMNADAPCLERSRSRSINTHQEQLRSIYLKKLEGEK